MLGSGPLLSTGCQSRCRQHRRLLSFIASVPTILEYSENQVRTFIHLLLRYTISRQGNEESQLLPKYFHIEKVVTL